MPLLHVFGVASLEAFRYLGTVGLTSSFSFVLRGVVTPRSTRQPKRTNTSKTRSSEPSQVRRAPRKTPKQLSQEYRDLQNELQSVKEQLLTSSNAFLSNSRFISEVLTGSSHQNSEFQFKKYPKHDELVALGERSFAIRKRLDELKKVVPNLT